MLSAFGVDHGVISKGFVSLDESTKRKMTAKERARAKQRMRNSTLIGAGTGFLVGGVPAIAGGVIGRHWSAKNITDEMKYGGKLAK